MFVRSRRRACFGNLLELRMALVKGTNCGFVELAPDGDPGGDSVKISLTAHALRCEAPAGAVKVTEIGWYSVNISEAANFEVAIYAHNEGDDNPEAIVGSALVNAKGTSAGWKRVTGLNIVIEPETTYWLAVQCDNTDTETDIRWNPEAGEKLDRNVSKTALDDPWGASGSTYAELLSIYAVYAAAGPKKKPSFGSISVDGLSGGGVPGIYK